MPEKPVFQAGERLFLWFLAAFSGAVLIYSFTLPHDNLSSPGIFPLLTGAVMLACILKILRTKRKDTAGLTWRQDLQAAMGNIFPKNVLVFTLILIAYILLLGTLPFLTSSFLFLVVSFLFLKGTTSWVRALLTAAGVLAGIFIVFQYIFKVVLW
jgi:hypothetical protein